MSTIEQFPEIESQIESSLALEAARFHFKEVVSGANRTDDYNATLVYYLNSLQNRWFEQSEEERYDVMSNLSMRIKTELALVLPEESTEPVEDIEVRLKTYLEDEVSDDLLKQAVSPYPRAANMVLLDMIDRYSPARS